MATACFFCTQIAIALQVVVQQQQLRRRSHPACDLCSIRKRRCDADGVNPCTTCLSAKKPCVYSGMAKSKRKEQAVYVRSSSASSVISDNSSDAGSESGGDGAGSSSSSSGRELTRGPHFSRFTLATGLGAAENAYLSTFLSAFGKATVTFENDIRGAMMHVLAPQQMQLESLRTGPAKINAKIAIMWLSIAHGAVLQVSSVMVQRSHFCCSASSASAANI